jgi:hypothetical protein
MSIGQIENVGKQHESRHADSSFGVKLSSWTNRKCQITTTQPVCRLRSMKICQRQQFEMSVYRMEAVIRPSLVKLELSAGKIENVNVEDGRCHAL